MMEDEEAIVDEPAVGSLVLAKWSGDGFFYPGKITSVDLVSLSGNRNAKEHGNLQVFQQTLAQQMFTKCLHIFPIGIPAASGCDRPRLFSLYDPLR